MGIGRKCEALSQVKTHQKASNTEEALNRQGDKRLGQLMSASLGLAAPVLAQQLRPGVAMVARMEGLRGLDSVHLLSPRLIKFLSNI